MRFSVLLLLAVGMMFSGMMTSNRALADCQAEGQQAAGLLMNFKEQALSNQTVDKNQFKAQFEPLVYRMKQDGCLSELMELMNLIQSEQQQYPAPKTAQMR